MTTVRQALDLAMTEKELQEGVVARARLHGWWAYHTHDSRRSVAGFPDLILVRDGELLAWELKREKGRMRPGQQEWLDKLATVAGVETAVIRPSTYDAALERLARPRAAT